MARPVKTGLDYFPFDTRQSTALQLLEAQCGAAGFGIYVHLLMQIYGDHGYYLPWSDDMALVMAYSSSTEPERIQQVVDVCVARRIFDPELYADAHILTSRHIQEVYTFGKRHSKARIDPAYDLIGNENDPVMEGQNPTKENKVKQKKTKQSDSRPAPKGASGQIRTENLSSESQTDPEVPPAAMLPIRGGGRYTVTKADADALARRFPRADVAGELVRMLNWLNHNPARRRKAARMPAFIESWIADAALSRPVDPAEPETDDAKRREGLIDALADADTKALWDMIPDEDKA